MDQHLVISSRRVTPKLHTMRRIKVEITHPVGLRLKLQVHTNILPSTSVKHVRAMSMVLLFEYIKYVFCAKGHIFLKTLSLFAWTRFELTVSPICLQFSLLDIFDNTRLIFCTPKQFYGVKTWERWKMAGRFATQATIWELELSVHLDVTQDISLLVLIE